MAVVAYQQSLIQGRLRALTQPDSIAVIGASDDPSRVGGMPIAFLREAGFAGRIYPVNSRRQQVQGLRSYTSIVDVPEPVDLVVIVLRADLVPDNLELAARSGARSAAIFSAGFAEVGDEGRQLQDRLVAVSHEYGMPVLGPNCAGFVNVRRRAVASFGSHLAADSRIDEGGLAIISQSGAVGAYLLTLTRRMGIGLSYWVTTGNEAVTSVADYIAHLSDDADTRVIALYIEQIADVDTFITACAAARARGKRIVALVGGSTTASEQARLSHTASLAGDYRLLAELLRDCGVVEVTTMSSLLTVSLALQYHELPTDNGVAVLTMSGAAGVLIADRCEQRGLTLWSADEETQSALKELVPFAGTANPVDFTGNVANEPGMFREFLDAVAKAGGVTSIVVFLGHLTLSPHLRQHLIDALVSHAREQRAPLYLVALLMPDDEERLRRAGIQLMADPADAVDTLAYVARAGQGTEPDSLWERRRGVSLSGGASPLPLRTGGVLNERDSQALLAPRGIRFPRQRLVTQPEMAAAAVNDVGGLAALKVLSADIVHKSDVGGVCLNVVASGADVAFRRIIDAVCSHAPQSDVEGILVQEQVEFGPQLLVGAVVDPHYGPYVMVGWGGVLTEYIGKSAIGLAPLTVARAQELIRHSGLEEVLGGVRGRIQDARSELGDWLVTLSELIWEQRDQLSEVEMNPVVVGSDGLIAVDALVRFAGVSAIVTDGEDS